MNSNILILIPWSETTNLPKLCQDIATKLGVARFIGQAKPEDILLNGLIGCLLAELDSDSHKRPREVLRDLSESGSLLSVIYLTRDPKPREIVEAIRHGAVDVLYWPEDANRLADAIKRAIHASEEAVIRRNEQISMRKKFDVLSQGERDVLKLALDAVPNKRVCKLLDIAQRTVEARRRRIFEKLGTRSIGTIADMLVKSGVDLKRLKGLQTRVSEKGTESLRLDVPHRPNRSLGSIADSDLS